MLKKFIAYQRLLLNSIPQLDMLFKNPLEILLSVFCIFVMCFMTLSIFMDNTISLTTILFIAFPITSVWMVNRIFYNDRRLFETIPISRKYIVLNVFLLSIVIVFIFSITLLVFGGALLGIILGIAYLVHPQSFNQSSPGGATYQIIDTTKGNMLMLCILIIILFVGIAITFIKSKKLRFLSFASFAIVSYVLLFLLKLSMPIYSSAIEFVESFSIISSGNTILFCVAIATVLICITSLSMGYKLYVPKANNEK